MVDGFSCILDLPKFSGEGPPEPPLKGNTSIKPSKYFFNNNNSQRPKKKKKKKRKLENPHHLKQSTRNLFLGYKEIEKVGGRWGKIIFVWFVIGLFETLNCALAEDKVCNSCIVNSWTLLIVLLCLWWWWPNSNFLRCVITQNGESNRDLLLSVTNRKALALGGTAPHPSPTESPLKH